MVPEDPSVAQEVSFQQSCTAEVCGSGPPSLRSTQEWKNICVKISETLKQSVGKQIHNAFHEPYL